MPSYPCSTSLLTMLLTLSAAACWSLEASLLAGTASGVGAAAVAVPLSSAAVGAAACGGHGAEYCRGGNGVVQAQVQALTAGASGGLAPTAAAAAAAGGAAGGADSRPPPAKGLAAGALSPDAASNPRPAKGLATGGVSAAGAAPPRLLTRTIFRFARVAWSAFPQLPGSTDCAGGAV